MKLPKQLWDTALLTMMIRKHQEACGHARCSVTFERRGEELVTTGCMEILELPGFKTACCNGPDCPQCP